MSYTFKITPSGFGWLAQAFSEKNAISPFAVFEKSASDFGEEEKEELISQDVISSNGTIKPAAFTALKVLSTAEAFSRIKILGTDSPVDKVTYFKDGQACTVDGGKGYFTVTYPALAKEACFTMEEFTGSSRLVNVPFRAVLPPKTAVVFLALVDLFRASALMALAGEPKTVEFTAVDIIDRANSSWSPMWFVRVLKDLVDTQPLSLEEVLTALCELKDNRLIEEKGGHFFLMDEALELAGTFLITEYVFNISCGRMISADACKHSECYVAFCGMHNLLYIDTEGDMVSLETISGSELLNILANLLQEPPA